MSTKTTSLYDTLKEAGKPLLVLELFQRAGFTYHTIDDFYEEMSRAIREGCVVCSRNNEKQEVFLEITD